MSKSLSRVFFTIGPTGSCLQYAETASSTSNLQSAPYFPKRWSTHSSTSPADFPAVSSETSFGITDPEKSCFHSRGTRSDIANAQGGKLIPMRSSICVRKSSARFLAVASLSDLRTRRASGGAPAPMGSERTSA